MEQADIHEGMETNMKVTGYMVKDKAMGHYFMLMVIIGQANEIMIIKLEEEIKVVDKKFGQVVKEMHKADNSRITIVQDDNSLIIIRFHLLVSLMQQILT